MDHRRLDHLCPQYPSIVRKWLVLGLSIITPRSFSYHIEVVLVLVGLVWGLGEGMGIAAAGTILGEAAAFL